MPCGIDEEKETCMNPSCENCPYWEEVPCSETLVCICCGVVWERKNINPENQQCLDCDGELLDR